jgi:hypothetical protein
VAVKPPARHLIESLAGRRKIWFIRENERAAFYPAYFVLTARLKSTPVTKRGNKYKASAERNRRRNKKDKQSSRAGEDAVQNCAKALSLGSGYRRG